MADNHPDNWKQSNHSNSGSDNGNKISSSNNSRSNIEGSSSSGSSSTRAYSRKNRVYAMREFVLKAYRFNDNDHNDNILEYRRIKRIPVILDVAGGKGDLSWLFQNFDSVDSVVVDPRPTDHRSLERSVVFLEKYPKEAAKRAVPGLPTHQPLASLLRTRACVKTTPRRPRHLRLYVDAALVEAVAMELLWRNSRNINEKDSVVSNNWKVYWVNATKQAESTCPIYGRNQALFASTFLSNSSNSHSNIHTNDPMSQQITDACTALEVILSADVIVGFHPDQATEACIDLAILLRIPFAICPCCVFPSEFPNRYIENDTDINTTKKHVKTYDEFIEYLMKKRPGLRVATLDMLSTTARNKVLYILPEDLL